jgi:hypothetical protein
VGEYESVLRGVDDDVHHRVADQHRPWDLRAAAVTIADSGGQPDSAGKPASLS